MYYLLYGVFVVGFQDNSYQRRMLNYYNMGEGPYYLFYRPYHLCHIESIANLLTCLRQQQPLLQPVFGHKTNVYAYAKKDLRSGQILDGVGGYACYGMIEMSADNAGLPICLAEGPILKTDILKGQKITLNQIDDLNQELFKRSKASPEPR